MSGSHVTVSVFRTPIARLFSLAILLVASSAWGAEGAAEMGPVNYTRDIKPILSARCYACHGPDQGQRKAELLLHVRASAVQEAIVPGDSAGSPLYQRVTSEDPEMRMPPPDSKKPALTAAEVDLVRRWIDEGAVYDTHWAFIKPHRPEPPAAPDPSWPANPIDQFIAAGHAQQGLAPAPEADRRILIRRLSFDLLGLPPTPEEIDAFVADAAPDAYTGLVERLLASEHYGERMALYWLDLVRYGDSAGYHSDNDRDVWLYRDYVIRAFNENKPFDRFTLEQLAGDLLPTPSDEQRIASAYNRMLMTTEEGGAQAKEYLAKYSADRVRNASSVWMGATLGCAECHDHKFDPYSTRDFYSFAAFFADLKELAVGRQEQTRLPSDEQKAELAALDARLPPLAEQLARQTPELDATQARWEEALLSKAEWKALATQSAASEGDATLTVLEDGSILAGGANPEQDTYTIAVTGLEGVTGIRLEVLPDDSLGGRGPGRSGNGNFVLNEFELSIADTPVKWGGITATHAQNDFPSTAAGDGNPATGWAILPQTGTANQAVFETAEDLGVALETTWTLRLRQSYGSSHAIGRFRISATTSPRPVRVDGTASLPPEIAAVLNLDAEARTDQDKQTLAAYYRSIAPELQPVRDELAQVQQRKEAIIQASLSVLVSMAVEPRPIRILPRGNWMDDTGEIVSPSVPDFLAPLPVEEGRRATRMDLARWLTSAENPLVARVAVNRLWKLLFGQGLVRSLDDFGMQGTLPSHPQLLDWLAVEFVESGWDVKHMLRLMLLSSAYRQSSQALPGQRERDPANTWLARQARFRLDAELVRDNALAVSGLLATKVGGPSVRPYQPAGYWAWLNFPVRDWAPDQGESQYRRGLYTWWQRTFLHPSLLAFDAPTREECIVDRPRSNTPLQALVLLNDPTYVEAARVLAERTIREGGQTTPDRLTFILRRVLGRAPAPREAEILSDLLTRHQQHFAAAPEAALQLLHVGEAPLAEGTDPVELAAWTSVARVILNLHESVTRN